MNSQNEVVTLITFRKRDEQTVTSTEETDFGQSRFGHPDLANLGQSNFGQSFFGGSEE